MKARIIGTILLLVVLGGLFILTQEDTGNKQPISPQGSQQSDPAFQPLKIN